MKKQILGLLIALCCLINTQPVQAGAVSKVASGTWQLVKIGTGLCLVVGGFVVAVLPCACAVGCAQTNMCGDLCKEIPFCKAGSVCCALTGATFGIAPILLGGVLVESGVKKLKKLNKKKHKHDHHTEHVDVVVHAK